MQWDVDGDAAATWAKVLHRPVTAADVEYAMLQFPGDFVDEFRRELTQFHEGEPRQKEFISLLPSMTYSQLSSLSRSL